MKAKIYITLKNGIHDPQGQAIQQSLKTLGFETVHDVRMGKFLEVDIEEAKKDVAESHITNMCRQLLANTVIEDFRYEICDS